MQQLLLWTPTLEPDTTRYEQPDPATATPAIRPFRLQEVRLSFTTSERPTIQATSPQDVITAFADLRESVREQFYALFLNATNEVIAADHISTGNIGSTSADAAEIVRTALLTTARSVIVLHDHPGGTIHPSNDDIAVTKAIRKALTLFRIALLDHIIIGRKGYYSFAEDKQLKD